MRWWVPITTILTLQIIFFGLVNIIGLIIDRHKGVGSRLAFSRKGLGQRIPRRNEVTRKLGFSYDVTMANRPLFRSGSPVITSSKIKPQPSDFITLDIFFIRSGEENSSVLETR